jgi:hypothetical protein
MRVPRMDTSDLTEIGRRVHDRLRYLREAERRNERGRGKRSRAGYDAEDGGKRMGDQTGRAHVRPDAGLPGNK